MENTKIKYEGENSPDYLREQIEIHKTYMQELENAKQKMQIQVDDIEAEIKNIKSSHEDELEMVINHLRNLTPYVEELFSDLRPGVNSNKFIF